MRASKVDVSVLLIFFARPDKFINVFNEVRKACPSRLFLYQDGPRANRPDDIENIKKCRDIAGNIDWECEVFTLYQEMNIGCDPSGYIAQRWAFSLTDKCIVLEDDVVPSQSFFTFCKEMLDKYEYDNRICMICGMNHLGKYKQHSYSYFYSDSGSIWGWASWQRVVGAWSEKYLIDDYIESLLKNRTKTAKQKRRLKMLLKMFKNHYQSGVLHFESVLLSYNMINSMLKIIPSVNLISNIGLGAENTHSSSDIRLVPKGLRKLFYADRYELTAPLKHPEYVICDEKYDEKVYRIMGWGYPLVSLYRDIVKLLLYIKYGNFRELKTKIIRRFGIAGKS